MLNLLPPPRWRGFSSQNVLGLNISFNRGEPTAFFLSVLVSVLLHSLHRFCLVSVMVERQKTILVFNLFCADQLWFSI